MISLSPRSVAVLIFCLAVIASPALAAESEPSLLDVLLENGSITAEQYETLSGQTKTGQEQSSNAPKAAVVPAAKTADESQAGDTAKNEEDDSFTERVGNIVAEKIAKDFPVIASYGSKGFRLETRDGNWQTNLQWRFQFRFTYPTRSNPRSVSDFGSGEEATFQARRIRMKIGGHGYKPWLKYYFEVDLQPTRNSSASSSNSSTRVIDWRVDVAKYKKFGIRVGQWKIDYNRERVDSSGRQQFVERSIVNRTFTIDRQMGVSFRGHLFEGTPADLRYAFGVFTGEGRGVANDDDNMMYTGRIQWNFMGRDLAFRQTDVERTEKPTGSLAFAAATTTGVCTRWSSGGCGRLDGYASPNDDDPTTRASQGQYRIHQAVQEFAFKYQGFSAQQEFHWKRVMDRSQDMNSALYESDLYGTYAQVGYFFHEAIESIPEELELAFRYAWLREPNEDDLLVENTRQEYTAAANWFFSGHNNKLTFDYSYLTLDDDVNARNVADHRFRFQWDISF